MFLVALCVPLGSFAEDVASVTPKAFPKNDCDYKAKGNSCFVSGAEFMDQYCRGAYLAASMENRAGAKSYDDVLKETTSCAKSAEAFLDPMYKEMLKRHKSKGAASAIKDFYAAQLSGLQGILPTGSESRMSYESRQATTKQGIRDKRARMELELK